MRFMIIISGEEARRIIMDISCIGPLFMLTCVTIKISEYSHKHNQVFSPEEMEEPARCRISINWPLTRSSENIPFIQKIKAIIVFDLESKRFIMGLVPCWT